MKSTTTLQHRIPFLPSDAEVVSQHIAVARENGRLCFFNASGPIFACKLSDERAMRFAAVLFTDPELGLATPSQIAKVIGRHRRRVHDYSKKFRDGGTEALAPML